MCAFSGILAPESEERVCNFTTYVCMEQPETLDYLKYLSIGEQTNEPSTVTLNFNSEGDQAVKSNKKGKKFIFDGLYNRSQKMKHQFAKLINDVATDVLKGENQTFFVYGTQEVCKDRIIFGESQNPGIFLCLLSEIFDLCHKKGLEDEVTVKLSCSLFNKAKFKDIFGGNSDYPIQFKKDSLQGGILHTVPQIIIRNVKTGLKLLNIISKHLSMERQEQQTQNFILTLKLQLDCHRTSQQCQIYCISKINFVKLANPSVNSSLKGINKNNIWYVSLLNYLQNSALGLGQTGGPFVTTAHANGNGNGEGSEEKEDQFTGFVRESYFRGSHKMYGFISITNKMNSNQCLSALLFANHLKNSKAYPQKCIINLPKLRQERHKLWKPLSNCLNSSQILINLWMDYCDTIKTYMSQLNYLQFEYSLVLGQACQKLSKYIFTEELQDFFYAKKTNVEKSVDLEEAYASVVKSKARIVGIQKKMMEIVGDKVGKDVLERFFGLELSMAYHFLYEEEEVERNMVFLRLSLEDLVSKRVKKQAEEELLKEKQVLLAANSKNQQNNAVAKPKIISTKAQKLTEQPKGSSSPTKDKSFIKEPLNSIHSKNQPQMQLKLPKKATNDPIDNLESMFKNKNVGMGAKILR